VRKRSEFFWAQVFVAIVLLAIVVALGYPLVKGIADGVAEDDRQAEEQTYNNQTKEVVP